MRILMVSHFYEAHGGGIERVAGHLSRQFAIAGHDVVWAASDGDPCPAMASVTALPLRCINPTERLTGLPMPIPGWRGLRTLIGAVARCDVVIVQDSLYVTSILAVVAAKIKRRQIVLIQHIAEIAFSSAGMRRVMILANRIVTRPMLDAAGRLVFISDVVRRELIGDPARRDYRLIFNGVDRALFHPAALLPLESVSRDEMQKTGSHFFASRSSAAPILFVGRYVEKKGLAVIRALAALRPDLRFDLVGSGPIAPSQWGLANIRDLGPQPPLMVADLYRRAALLLLPSVGEGFPLVIQEAMACGLPVICGHPTERADPAAGAWLAGVAIDLGDPAGSARRCADAIDRLALDRTARAAMANYAAQAYSWQGMAAAVLEGLDGEGLPHCM